MSGPLPGGPLAEVPEGLRRTMAEIGPVWGRDIQKHRDIVLAAYLPLQQAAPKGGIEVVRNVPYGRHPRQVADIYRPASAAGAPVLIFVHGGAFVRGDRDLNDEVYGNVLRYFARNGYVGVNMEYRLAPEAAFPAGAEDVGLAIAWAAKSIAAHGGDPQRIFLVGHSAGGTHAASWVFDERVRAGRPAGIVAQALISARLRADAAPENPNAQAVRAYFGADESRYEERSPVTHGAASSVPTLIAVAQFENPLLDVYGAELFHRMCAAGRTPRFVQMVRHNHISIVAHFNTGEDILGAAIVDFFDGR